MSAIGENLPSIYLHPGEIHITDKPFKVVTVLGSCISLTIFSKRFKMGAICHGVMPNCRSEDGCRDICIDAFRYVECSIKHLINSFRDHGIRKSDMEVKIFGGADTLLSKRRNSIGSSNIRVALGILENERLPLSAADVGDNFGRKIIFLSHTGEVFVKRFGGNGNFGKVTGR